jgi:hypothetical protein
MLLTFLGLTLATTSSTELQIATNYRWSQQALYNAEAGLEAGKILLSEVANVTGDWGGIVPVGRSAPWSWGTTQRPAGWPGAGRDFDRSGTGRTGDPGPGCQERGGGAGYGLVLVAPAPGGSTQRWENVSTFMGQTLNGAFTVWVRRRLVANPDGRFLDDTENPPDTLVLTAEGVAPYQGASTAFTRANQAVRILEMTYSLATRDERCEEEYGGQEGKGQSGDNFSNCSRLGPGGMQKALGGAAGAGGRVGSAGTLARLP